MNIILNFLTANTNMNIILKKYSRIYSNIQIFATLCHVLLKAYPSLEGNVAYDKADPSVCH